MAAFVLLIAAAAGGVFGYGKYTEWAKAKKNADEILQFNRLSFRNDPGELAESLAKLPTSFRIEPPSLDFVNAYLMSERFVRKQTLRNGGVRPAPVQQYQVPGVSSNDSQAESYYSSEKAVEFRLDRAARIDGYRYSKDSAGELIVDVRFVAAILQLERLGRNSNVCADDVDCVTSATVEKMAQMQIKRTGDKWHVLSVNCEDDGRDSLPWSRASDPAIDKRAASALVPNKILPPLPLNPGSDTRAMQFY